ncbi:hypothetical protein EYF80_041296 [Liparis tanakae]|uniref:Uncharacterized protein n=1 Tax=Liparis tanakae TaxID=230148 RepID=A0A4Z2G4P0_9TELE|nr:hypothetical protein EYF80_041296 [Liparis tanakae]
MFLVLTADPHWSPAGNVFPSSSLCAHRPARPAEGAALALPTAALQEGGARAGVQSVPVGAVALAPASVALAPASVALGESYWAGGCTSA